MAADAGVEAGGPNLNLNVEEKRAYGQLFRQADTDGVGVVTGDIAVKFFEKTRLDSRILGEIWQIADKENRGFLTPAGFGVALRLIGHAQAGREPSPEMALQQGPIPRFEGIASSGPPAPPPPAALQAQGTGGAPIRIPPLTPEKVAQYAGLFERQPLQGGNMLPGDQAKSIFEKSGLPNEFLGRIWQLADTEQRGALVMAEFVIAMHLLASMKSGALRGLPTILPAALYDAATRRAPTGRQSPQTTGQPLSAIPRQLSGSTYTRQGSPLGRSQLQPQATGLVPQTTGSDWLVTPAEKARYDQFYADLDKTNKGFITGDEAVPFLSQSNLSEDALAQVWDLADINSEGRLTKDTFAVAMYLIRQQRGRRDGANTLPATLPPNLIPPSLRGQVRPTSSAASPFDAPIPAPAQPQPPQPPPAPKSALDDLFGLDAPSPAPAQTVMSTGGSATRDPFASASPIAPASPIRASPTGPTFKPFIPASSFGQTLTAQGTGGSGAGSPAPPNARLGPSPMPPAVDDLLGDTDPVVSSKLTNETTELANLSNQINSLSNQMQQVQGQRTTTQKEVTQSNQQKRNFEERLTQLRTLYEKEAKDVSDLKDQLQKSRDDTRKLMAEMATIDGSYRDLQTQHQQMSAALQADQQENASLKQRISAVNQEIAHLKPQIEKLKSTARQQKGLVAINKKQLSTTEGERDKLKSEAEDVARASEDGPHQLDASPPATASAQVAGPAAVAGPDAVTSPAAVASPAPSTASANNPFFRRTGSTDVMGAFSPPAAKAPYGEKSFDDIFGGFSSGSASHTPPPGTSFKQQGTGNSSASLGSLATPAASTTTVSQQADLAAQPPPPPLSRQITSSFLPLGDATESLTSSRQASPPLSRVGDDNAPAATLAANPLEPAVTGQSARSNGEAAVPAPDRPAGADNGTVPGAFPDETPGQTPSFGGNGDSDPFEGLKRAPTNAKEDFDSAFANLGGPANKPQEKPKNTSDVFSSFASEFPPISEPGLDEDSDSTSEGNGFDDDFDPASPPGKADGKETPRAPSSPAATPRAPAVSGVTEANGTTTAVQSSHETPSIPQHAAAAPPKAEDPFAPGPDFVPAPTTATNTAPAASNGAFDDVDDFEGLEDAKEGSADDEFANGSRSNLDSFSSGLNGSPPSSQPKSESMSASNATAPDTSYGSETVSTSPTGTSGPGPDLGAKSQDPNDWDAIFATLDDGKAAVDAPKPGEEALSPGLQSQSSGRPSTVGRMLTEEGTHDDPILKNLTSMGYSRKDALNALEKYDYNLERAANYLASQS